MTTSPATTTDPLSPAFVGDASPILRIQRGELALITDGGTRASVIGRHDEALRGAA